MALLNPAPLRYFKQLYTIHGFNKRNDSIIPLIYCLLPDKKMETYKIVFHLIKSQFRNWMPKKITIDFELAVIKAVKKVYRDIQVKGCYFHFSRCLLRKAKQLKIISSVQKRHVAKCIGIARLPPEHLEFGYQYVMSKCPSNEKIEKFNKYFQTHWIKRSNFSELCSCDKEQIRTTNNIEGWHSRINRFIGRTNPSLSQLLEVLSKETKVIDIFKSKAHKKKAENYTEIDNEIKKSLQDLNAGTISVGHCLEMICPYYFYL